MGKIETFVSIMENLCNDNSHGYSQVNRWGPDYDCSSAIITALRQAGFDTGSASYTGNMSSELCARGWTRLPASSAKQRGDILLNDTDHTAVYCGNNLLAEFSIAETGGVTGQAGDQTGQEAYIHSYYDFPWNCILRYTREDGWYSGNVTVQPNTGAADQRWQLIQSGAYYKLRNKANGKMLDLYNAETANGTNIHVYDENGSDAQLFKLSRIRDGHACYYTLEPKLTPGKLVSVENNGVGANNVKIYENLNNSKQRFWLRQETDGCYLILHIYTFYCISARD